MLELFANIGVRLARVVYDDNKLFGTDTGRRWPFVLSCSCCSPLSVIEQFIRRGRGYFALRGGSYTRKLVGQVFHVWSRNRYVAGGTRGACVTSGSLGIERGLNNCASMRAVRCASETSRRRA